MSSRCVTRGSLGRFSRCLVLVLLASLALAGSEDGDVYETELLAQKEAYKSHMKAGDIDAAVAVLLPYVEQYANTVTAARLCEHIGQSYMQKKDYPAAIAVLSQAKDHAPDSQWAASAQELIAHCYMQMGNFPKTIETYQGLADSCTTPELWALARTAQQEIAWTYVQMGEFLKAIGQYRRVWVSFNYPDFEPSIDSTTFHQRIPWGGTPH